MNAPDGHVVIIGAGFSGSLLAINLLRHGGPRVTLIERRAAQIGRGVAYSAADPGHLLNVRAGNMSALPDAPDHFTDWLSTHRPDVTGGFAPRTVYGIYLQHLLNEARAHSGKRLNVIAGEAVALRRTEAGFAVEMDDGISLAADRVVLAIGNLPPHTPAGLDPAALPADVYAADPWAGDIAEGLAVDDTVVLLGTGLTAIDAALLLETRGFRGRILALSRRGLVPRRHVAAGGHPQGLSERPGGTLSGIVRSVRRRAREIGWRDAVDELRPVTQMLWSGADIAARARFLRHLRPFWDVHRHRLAPSVAARVDAMCNAGRLAFAAGKIASATAERAHARLAWRPRHCDVAETIRTRRIVNCTGPQGDLLRTREPLLRQLIADGQIRPDALRLGLDVDAWSHAIDRDGAVQENLYCLGPMARSGLWEVVAVPDLRRQSWDLARILANAHWVGGEGL